VCGHTHDVGQHLVALVEGDNRWGIGRLELSGHRTAYDGPAVDLACPVAALPPPFGRETSAAVLGGREVRGAAGRAVLIAQFCGAAALPERVAEGTAGMRHRCGLRL